MCKCKVALGLTLQTSPSYYPAWIMRKRSSSQDEHNPANQPTVEYELADVTTANDYEIIIIGYWLPDNMFTL
ncbi:hypothetical protein T01_6393 [Trichinella spiralis]|uniref:Uncharacterized protein n=1 Tax=Trichinella spiralis TaxID=6334 RepID=A0A0V1APP3_TRISP|nr:hypothetical protein T01_6393 [Trichinella spiralis]